MFGNLFGYLDDAEPEVALVKRKYQGGRQGFERDEFLAAHLLAAITGTAPPPIRTSATSPSTLWAAASIRLGRPIS